MNDFRYFIRLFSPLTVLLWIIILTGTISSCIQKKDLIDCDRELFGRPMANTGLSVARCKPDCGCKDFSSRLFSPAELEGLRKWTLTQEVPELTSDPYKSPVPDSEPCLCAVVVDDAEKKEYHLETFPDEAAAAAAGGIVTHYDACGLCSSLEDFAVYARNLDVGKPVRECGLNNFNEPFEVLVECIMELGFSKPCAQIWAYNVRNTQSACLQECLETQKYHNPDGTLSPCLQCDEDKSGPVFKAVAGRTRRNTGIASSICRPCNEVQKIEHRYE